MGGEGGVGGRVGGGGGRGGGEQAVWIEAVCAAREGVKGKGGEEEDGGGGEFIVVAHPRLEVDREVRCGGRQ